MRHSLLTLLALTFILATSPLVSIAGPVSALRGAGEVLFDPGFAESYETPFPGTGEVVIEGDDPSNPGGAADAIGKVRYALGQSDAGAVFDLELENVTGGGWAVRGSTFFSIDFETDRPLRYTLEAVARGGGDWSFSADLEGVASAHGLVEQQEEHTAVEGNMPFDGNRFGPLVQEGVLPAGSHSFFARARADRDDFALGQVTLTLDGGDAPGPNPIPLPAAFPAALAGILPVAALTAVRRARRLRRQQNAKGMST